MFLVDTILTLFVTYLAKNKDIEQDTKVVVYVVVFCIIMLTLLASIFGGE